MKREELQQLGLSDEQINAVMAQNGRDIENARHSAPDAEAEMARADRLQEQLTQLSADLAAAQETATSAAALRKSFNDLTAKHNAMIKASAIRDALAEYKPRDAAMLARLLDDDKITFEDGKLTGLKEQVEPLKASSGYLFADTPDSSGGNPNSAPAGGAFDFNAFLRGDL